MKFEWWPDRRLDNGVVLEWDLELPDQPGKSAIRYVPSAPPALRIVTVNVPPILSVDDVTALCEGLSKAQIYHNAIGTEPVRFSLSGLGLSEEQIANLIENGTLT